MRLLHWNCRGIARPAAVNELRALIREHNPECVFLSEIKVDSVRVEGIFNRLGFYNVVSVSAVKKAGGLCLAWRKGVDLDITLTSKNCINALVLSDPPSTPWMMSLVYGPPYWKEKAGFWNCMDELANTFGGPWLALGDFNCITSQTEKKGGRPFACSSNRGLSNFLEEKGMVDLGFRGSKFTWDNGNDIGSNIKQRLDRGVANIEWRALFSKAVVVHSPIMSSDHASILLDTMGETSNKSRTFKFEAMWVRDRGCGLVIENAWRKPIDRGSVAFKVCQKIRVTKKDLSVWNKNVYGHLQTNIKTTKEVLDRLQQDDGSLDQLCIIANLKAEYEELLRREEIMWHQKSRVQWLQVGEKSTKFFHLSTVIRRRRNVIEALKGDDGLWTSDAAEIEHAFVSNFSSLFSTTSPRIPAGLEGLIESVITNEENASLCAIPNEDEIKSVFFHMGSTKSPGPDGMSANFFKSYWHIIKHDIVKAIQRFFSTGFLLKELNQTHIALIPKIEGPSKVNHYRPISLCNVIYKAISKILTNRLQPLLRKMISPMQSAFVPGRLISDNSILAYEVMHQVKYKKGKKGLMALKLDMERAYDQIEWPFLMEVLKCFGFAGQWCQWIFQCISTVSFAVLINGSPKGKIIPQRGLRQGDPLSPFLFIICSEVLSRLINREAVANNLSGICVKDGCPPITHLLFADDLIVFGRANMTEVDKIFVCLNKYQAWSGQCINYNKSNIMLSRNLPNEEASAVASAAGLKRAEIESKYLGLPLACSRSKKEMFGSVIERVQARLKGWKAKLLSQSARSTLIRTVVQATPTYTMSTFLLPKTSCEQLDGIIRRFWWGVNDTSKRSLYLKGWDSMCAPKAMGGLGFKRIWDFNKALVAKQAWAVLTGAEKSWVQIMEKKYLKGQSFFECGKSRNSSWLWQGILKCRNLIAKGACRLIGDGKDVDILNDPWIPYLDGFKPQKISNDPCHVKEVSELIVEETGSWNVPLIETTFDAPSVEAILRSRPSRNRVGNGYVWCPNPSGIFSSKSAYLKDQDDRFSPLLNWTCKNWNSLWNSKIHERHKLFLWKLKTRSIPSRGELAKRIPGIDCICPLCECGDETLEHLFLGCSVARLLWRSFKWPINSERFASKEIGVWILAILDANSSLGIPIAEQGLFLIQGAVILEQIWKIRNDLIFRNLKVDLVQCKYKISSLICEHQGAQTELINASKPLFIWEKPPKNWVKANFDVATNGDGAVLAVVVRDDQGKLLAAHSHKTPLVEVEVLEAMAALLAVEEGFSTGKEQIIFEGDASIVIYPLMDWNLEPQWNISNLITDIKAAMPNAPMRWSFSKANRLANGCAHNLAKWALTRPSFGCIQIDDLPSEVMEFDN